MSPLLVELRHALRRLRRSPGFALVSLLTLTLGIGLNVAIFSLVYGVLLERLPYPESGELVVISHEAPALDLDDMDISPVLYRRYAETATSFDGLAMAQATRLTLRRDDAEPQRVDTGIVTASLFPVLGVRPVLGRALLETDEEPGAEAVAVISSGLWRRLFGGAESTLDRTLVVGGVSRRIVGVAPPELGLPDERTEIWLPLVRDPENEQLGNFGAQAYGRLGAGATLAAATTDLERVTGDLVSHFPDESAAPILQRSAFRPMLVPLLEDQVGFLREVLWVLFAAVGFVLLMACVNVANLFLVRAESRQRELALRTALGASRRSLALSFLTEGVVLALAGGLLSLPLAHFALQLLVRGSPENIPRIHEVDIDGAALGFAIAISLASALLFALLPALQQRAKHLAGALKDTGRSFTASRGRVRLRSALVVAQVALGFVLLIAAGLMVRSFRQILAVDPGVATENRLTFTATLPASSYESAIDRATFVEQALERLRGLPGVLAVGATSDLPFSGSGSGAGHAARDQPLTDDSLPTVFMTKSISSDSLRATGIPLLEGRDFTASDHVEQTDVVIVSQAVARRLWPDGSALGRQILPGRPGDDARWQTVIGVAGDVRDNDLEGDPTELVYYPMANSIGATIGNNVGFVIHTAVEPMSLAELAKQAVWEVDPNLPVTRTATLAERLAEARAGDSFSMILMSLAAGLALGLGALGIYGVISYLVSQRVAEIGVRMALGAGTARVRRQVVRDGVLLAAAGIAFGLVGAVALTRFLEGLLYATEPLDPVVFLLVPALLVAIAAIASLGPALRASRVDPMVALRAD